MKEEKEISNYGQMMYGGDTTLTRTKEIQDMQEKLLYEQRRQVALEQALHSKQHSYNGKYKNVPMPGYTGHTKTLQIERDWEGMDISHLDHYKKLIYRNELKRLRDAEQRLTELLNGPAITLEDIKEESPKKERIKLFKR